MSLGSADLLATYIGWVPLDPLVTPWMGQGLGPWVFIKGRTQTFNGCV